MYSRLNTEFVRELHLAEFIFKHYEENIKGHGGFDRVLQLLSIIAYESAQFHTVNSSGKSTASTMAKYNK